jgi:hypothetical protein
VEGKLDEGQEETHLPFEASCPDGQVKQKSAEPAQVEQPELQAVTQIRYEQSRNKTIKTRTNAGHAVLWIRELTSRAFIYTFASRQERSWNTSGTLQLILSRSRVESSNAT